MGGFAEQSLSHGHHLHRLPQPLPNQVFGTFSPSTHANCLGKHTVCKS